MLDLSRFSKVDVRRGGRGATGADPRCVVVGVQKSNKTQDGQAYTAAIRIGGPIMVDLGWLAGDMVSAYVDSATREVVLRRDPMGTLTLSPCSSGKATTHTGKPVRCQVKSTALLGALATLLPEHMGGLSGIVYPHSIVSDSKWLLIDMAIPTA